MAAPSCRSLESVCMWRGVLKSEYASSNSAANIRLAFLNALWCSSVQFHIALAEVMDVKGANMCDRLAHISR